MGAREQPIHGTRQYYRSRRCRCTPCRAANAAYESSRRVQQPNTAEVVDARESSLHLTRLRGQGVGYRQAARLAGLSDTLVSDVRAGRLTHILASTAQRILAVRAILAHGQTVTGWRTARLLDSLQREGYRNGEILRRLGARRLPGQLDTPSEGEPAHHQRVRVRSALRVRLLWQAITEEDPT